MNKKSLPGTPKILTYFSFSVLAILVLSLTSGVYAGSSEFKDKLPGDNHGDNHASFKNCKKSDSLEEISIKIDAEKCEFKDLKDYKKWDFYKLEDAETKACLKFYNDRGNSLSDYELIYCYAYPERYYDDEK